MEESNKAKWQRRIPIITVSVLCSITLYITFWAWVKILSLAMSHYTGVATYYVPSLVGKFDGVSILIIPFVAVISIAGWILSTRVPKIRTPFYRVTIFGNMILANAGILIAFGMTQIQNHLLPFFYERLDRVIETSSSVDEALFGQTQGFLFMLVMSPLLIALFIAMFLVTKYRSHDERLKAAFLVFLWRGELYRKFEKLSVKKHPLVELPDIEFGIAKDTKEMVVLPGFDRSLNTIIVGGIGTGKSATLALPSINSDLHNFTRFLNDFEKISRMDNYKSEDVQGRYINGLTVIEPSNDLCQKVYKLAKAHNIPDSAITYIDPTNPNTPSLNVMHGPTDKVAEVFTMVIEGLSDNGGSGNFYFEQAQRSHLKQYIYLLKTHDPDKDVDFEMLNNMYQDTSLVRKMHMELKRRIPSDEELNQLTDRDEYNYWDTLRGVDKWFDANVVMAETFTPQGPKPIRNEQGDIVYLDAMEKDIKGLRNILNDISTNPLIRRVLFGKSKFDFDEHLGSLGGILLVNTARGEMGSLGRVLGKLVLMTMANATFRRPPEISTYHHIVIDEAPEYLYNDFASFPTQSRKYKVIISVLLQTLTQLRGAFGEDFLNAVVASTRNRMVYADVPYFDAKYFSDMFGEKEVYDEGETEQSISPLQDNPVSRSGSSYSLKREAALTASDVLFQDAFECALKIVVNNKSMPVQQIKANFVPKKDFKKAIITVDEDAAEYWTKVRNNQSPKETTPMIEGDLESIDLVADQKVQSFQVPAEVVNSELTPKPTPNHVYYENEQNEVAGVFYQESHVPQRDSRPRREKPMRDKDNREQVEEVIPQRQMSVEQVQFEQNRGITYEETVPTEKQKVKPLAEVKSAPINARKPLVNATNQTEHIMPQPLAEVQSSSKPHIEEVNVQNHQPTPVKQKAQVAEGELEIVSFGGSKKKRLTQQQEKVADKIVKEETAVSKTTKSTNAPGKTEPTYREEELPSDVAAFVKEITKQ